MREQYCEKKSHSSLGAHINSLFLTPPPPTSTHTHTHLSTTLTIDDIIYRSVSSIGAISQHTPPLFVRVCVCDVLTLFKKLGMAFYTEHYYTLFYYAVIIQLSSLPHDGGNCAYQPLLYTQFYLHIILCSYCQIPKTSIGI